MEMVFESLKIDIKRKDIQDVINNMDIDGINFEASFLNVFYKI